MHEKEFNVIKPPFGLRRRFNAVSKAFCGVVIMFWVYILKCADSSYYTGHTDNLENRLVQHSKKLIHSCYTATRLPVTLIFSQTFETRYEALSSERQIKGWSRKKKEALINGDWNLLSILAKRTKKI